jgi:hypothetical protein
VPNDEFAEGGVRRGQSVLIVASAASVAAVVAVVALIVHPWRDTAGRSNAARATSSATSSDSPLASPATSLPAVSVSEPAFSAAPASSPTATNGPSAAPHTTPSASRRTSPAPAGAVVDSQPNFKVSIVASPTHVVLGQQTRITVTIVNAGGLFDRSVVMAFGGSDPSDNFSDAAPPCTAGSGVTCPITGARPGRTWSFTFTFIPGPFPAMGHFDDALSAVFDYTDSHGEQQQTPQYFETVRLFDAPATSPPASDVPGQTPPPSTPPALAASTSATSPPTTTALPTPLPATE